MEKPQGLDEEDGKFSYCLACRNKLNSSLGKRVVVCDRCPAAFHAQCAGYASVKAIPEGEWLCWACSKDGNKFLFPTSKYQGRVEEPVRIGYVEPNSNSRCFVTFYEATVETVTEQDLIVRWPQNKTTETLPRNSPSIWRGTLQKEAWVVEKDAHWEHWQPRSRGDKWPVVSAAKRYLASRRKSHLDQEQPLPSQQQKQQEEEQSLHQEQQQQRQEEAEEPSQQRKRKEREQNRQGPAQQPETHGPTQPGVVQSQQQQKQPGKREARQAVSGAKPLASEAPIARREADKAAPPSKRARLAGKPQQHLQLPNGAEKGPCATGGGPIAGGSPASLHGSPLGSRHGRRPRGSGKPGKSPCPEPSERPAVVIPAGEGSLPCPKAATQCSPHTTPADSAKQAAVSHLKPATADELKGAVSSIPPRAAAHATAAAACGSMVPSASSPRAPTSNAALTVADAKAGAAPALTQSAVAHCKASVGGPASKRTVQKVAGVDRTPVGEAELAASQQVASPTGGATAGDSGRAAALLVPGKGLAAEVRPTSTAAAVGAGATAIQQPPPPDAAPPQPSAATAVSSELAKEANKASNEMQVLRKIRTSAASSLKRERPKEQAPSGQLRTKIREGSQASGEAVSKGNGTGEGGSSERSAHHARTESQAASAATEPAAASPAGAGVEAKVQEVKASAASGRGATDVSKPRLADRAAELQAAGAGQPGIEPPGAGRECLIAGDAPNSGGAGASAGTFAAVSQDAAAAPGSLAQKAGRGGVEAELPAGGGPQPAKDKRAGPPAKEHEGDQPGKADREAQPAKATEHGAAAGGEAPAASKSAGSTGRAAAADGPQPASAAGDPAAAGAMAPEPLASPTPSSLEQAKCEDMPPKRRKLSGKGAVLSPAPGSAKAARGAGDTAAGQGAQGAAGTAAGDVSAAELARQHWRVAGGGAASARATPLQLLKRMARGELKLATLTMELPAPGRKARPAYEVVGEVVSAVCIGRQRALQHGSQDVAVSPAGSIPAAAPTAAGPAVRAGGHEQGPGPALQPQAEHGGADPHAAPAEGPQEPAAPSVLAPAQTHRPPVALAPAVEASWKSLAAAPAAAAGPGPPIQQPEPAACPGRPLGQKEQDGNLAGTVSAVHTEQAQHQPRQQPQPAAAASQPHPHQRPLQQQQQRRPAAAEVHPGQPPAQQQEQWALPGALPMHPLPASAALVQQWAAGAKSLPQHTHVAQLPRAAGGPSAPAAAAALAAHQAGGGAPLAGAGLAIRSTAPQLAPTAPSAAVVSQQAAAMPTAATNHSARTVQHAVPWPPAAPPGVLLVRSTAVNPWQQAGGQAPVLQGRMVSGQPLQAAHHWAASGAGTVPAVAGGGGTGLVPAARAGAVPAAAPPPLRSAATGVPRVPTSAAMLPAGGLAFLTDSGVPVSGYTQQSMTPEQAAWVQQALAARQAAALQQAMAAQQALATQQAMAQPLSAPQALAAQQAAAVQQAMAAQQALATQQAMAQQAAAVQQAMAAQQALATQQAMAQPLSAPQALAAQQAAAVQQAVTAQQALATQQAAAQPLSAPPQALAAQRAAQQALAVQQALAAQRIAGAITQPQSAQQAGAAQKAVASAAQHFTAKQLELASLEWHQQPQWQQAMQSALHQQQQQLKAWQQQHVATRLAMQPASEPLAQQHSRAAHAGGVGWPLQVARGPVVITAPQVNASCAVAGASPRPAGAAAAGMPTAGGTIAPPAGTPAATAAAAAAAGAAVPAAVAAASASVGPGACAVAGGFPRQPPHLTRGDPPQDRQSSLCAGRAPSVPSLSEPALAPVAAPAGTLISPLVAPAATAAALEEAAARLRAPTLGSASLQSGGAGGGDAVSDTLEEGEILDDPAPLLGALADGPGLSAAATAPAAVASPTPPAGLAAPMAPDGSAPATCSATPSALNGNAPATSTAAAQGWVAGPAPVREPVPEAPFRPGVAVEAMPRDHLGGWYEGRVVQVDAGTPEEGGWRLLVHFPAGSTFTTAATGSGASQEWVPIVSHQEAGGGGSSPMLRVRHKQVPLLAGGHKCVVVGQEVEVPALHAWWPAVVRSISNSMVEVEYLQAPPAIAGSGRRWWPVSIRHVRKPPQPPPYAAQLLSGGEPAAPPSLPAAATAADGTQSTAHAARQPVGVALEEEALTASAGATTAGGAAAASAQGGRPASLAVAVGLGGDPPRPAHGGEQWPARYEQAQREQGHQAQHDEEAQQQHAPVVLQHGTQAVDGATDAPLLVGALL